MSLTKVTNSMIVGAAVNVQDYGVDITGATDNTTQIQTAINDAANGSLYFPAGIYYWTGLLTVSAPTIIYGDGYSTQLNPVNAGGNTLRINSSHVSISNLRIEGTTPGGIAVGYSGFIQHILIENCYFKTIGQAVWLWTVDNVMVQNCTFDNTGYGVIQQAGYSSNYVTVSSCIANNMAADFVNMNSSTVPSESWVITSNIFTGSASYPSTATEERFVDVTSCKNVIIANNLVRNVAGDAAIHLEDTLGDTIIDGNIFDNCLGSGGNNGYIYVLASTEHVVITNNIFMRSDASLPLAYAYSSSANPYSNDLVFSNNKIHGNGIGGNLGGLAFGGGSGVTVIDGNLFNAMETCINTGTSAISNASVTNNNIYGATNFYFCGGVLGPSGGGGSNVLIQGNLTSGVTGYDICIGQNSSGTTPCSNISILGNVFSQVSLINELSTLNTNVVYANNVLKSTATTSFASTTQQYLNYVSSGSTFNAVSLLSNYANDAAASAGGVPVGGMYRNASVVQIRVV